MANTSATHTASNSAHVSRSLIYTDLYELVEAVQDAGEPGAEAWVGPLVRHLLRQGQARWLRPGAESLLREATLALQPCPAEYEVLV
ncbi:MAG: hypothetical protein AB7N91_05300 [Candidatus Tectimicrobiota bacterium]